MTPADLPAPPRTVVVVPCHDEARRLRAEGLLELAAPPWRTVLAVDDGSADQTLSLLRAAAARWPDHLRVLALGTNRGKGEAVRAGLLAAIAEGAQLVGYYDADLATPPSEMVRLLGLVSAGGPRVALAARVALLGRRIERRPARHYLGRVFATAASLALGMAVYDTQCGAKALWVDEALRGALREPFTSRWVFDVELLLRLGARGVPATDLVEMPLSHWRDTAGSRLSAAGMAGAARDLARLAWQARRRG